MKLSIVIINFNRKQRLLNLLASIKENVKGYSHEVIVIDNGSSDASTDAVKNNFPEVVMIAEKRNIGECAAFNKGIRGSQGEYVWLMQEDIIIHKDTAKHLIEFLDTNSPVGYVGPKSLDEKGNVIKSIEKFHTPIYDIFFSYKHILSKIYRKFIQSKEKTLSEKPVKADWMTLSCLMIRGAALKKVGLFEDDITQWWADPQIALKLHRAGWEGYYIPYAEITHYQGITKQKARTTEKVDAVDLLWIYSKYKYFKKFYGPFGLFVVECNDFIIFTSFLLINLFKYYFVSHNVDTKWLINKWFEYLKCILGIGEQPSLAE